MKLMTRKRIKLKDEDVSFWGGTVKGAIEAGEACKLHDSVNTALNEANLQY